MLVGERFHQIESDFKAKLESEFEKDGHPGRNHSLIIQALRQRKFNGLAAVKVMLRPATSLQATKSHYHAEDQKLSFVKIIRSSRSANVGTAKAKGVSRAMALL